MSNRVVSSTYRTIIDDVIANVRQDFEDMGIEKEVLDELQRSWEAKIVATGVADFEGAAPVAPRGKKQPKENGNGSEEKKEGGVDGGVKKEEDDNSSLPLNNGKIAKMNGSNDVHGNGGDEQARFMNGHASTSDLTASGSSLNGGSNEENENKRKRPLTDENEIGSDLDDSDEDEMEGNVDADGNEDMILCLYDKVQRVRNKWKCILKDGVASIDGRDYVFSKLSSELEW